MKKHALSIWLLAAFFIISSLSGCGSSYSSSKYADYAVREEPAEAPMAAAGDYGWEYESNTAAEEAASANSALPANVKMIYTADISLESTEFTEAAEGLEKLVKQYGGWFESSQTDNSRSYRTSYYTVRIPAQHFDIFCGQVGELCQVNSITRRAEDVSERYYDTEARLTTQNTKLARLQELLTQAENMEDIITLESAISDTELEIEQLTGTLRKYDSLVGYSTIDITLREDYKLTEDEAPAIGFGAKLAAAFRAGTSSFVDGVQEFMLAFARNWADWLVFLAIVFCAVKFLPRLLSRSRTRLAEKREKNRENKQPKKSLFARLRRKETPTVKPEDRKEEPEAPEEKKEEQE